MTAPLHDFRKPSPLPPALRAALANWGPQVCSQATRLWATQLPFAVEMESCGLQVMPARQALDALPESALCFRANLEQAPDLAFLAVARPLTVAVVGGLLGNVPAPEELDQELTPVEEEIVEFVADQFFLDPLQKSWPLADKLRLASAKRESISAESAYPPALLLLVARFSVRTEFGEFSWWWMIPRNGWLASLEGSAAAEYPSRADREETIQDLRVKMTVRLGASRLSLLHLATLQVGDLLLLDQRIDQPLPAILGGKEKFRVWPGARGARQAVSIDTPTEP